MMQHFLKHLASYHAGALLFTLLIFEETIVLYGGHTCSY